MASVMEVFKERVGIGIQMTLSFVDDKEQSEKLFLSDMSLGTI